jgi:hypothetical protein
MDREAGGWDIFLMKPIIIKEEVLTALKRCIYNSRVRVTSRGIKIRVKRCYIGVCNIGLTPSWVEKNGVGCAVTGFQ